MRAGRLSTAIALATLLAWTADGVIFDMGRDDFDDLDEIRSITSEARVAAFREEIDAVTARLIKLKERDIERLFGQPVPKPPKTYAMPVAEPRGFALSGLRYADPEKNRDHTEFYVFGRAALEVHYSIDGVSPSYILLVFKTDQDFPRLTDGNLGTRLAWDRVRMDEFEAELDERWAEVFVWRVDADKEKILYADLFVLDLRAKLDAWIAFGERSGFDLRIRKDPEGRDRRWSWYRKDGRLALEARCEGVEDTLPRSFKWYPDDSKSVSRTEYTGAGGKSITCWWWCPPESTRRFRCEFSQYGDWRPNRWSWGGGNSNEFHRQEWDDNQDGIPDWYSESTDGYVEHSLQVSNSWAVQPLLIPEDYRISDQPNRCVPVCRIVPRIEAKNPEAPNHVPEDTPRKLGDPQH